MDILLASVEGIDPGSQAAFWQDVCHELTEHSQSPDSMTICSAVAAMKNSTEEVALDKECAEVMSSVLTPLARRLVEEALAFGAVRELDGREDVPHSADDFANACEKGSVCMKLLQHLFTYVASLQEGLSPKYKTFAEIGRIKQLIAFQSVLLASEHFDCNLWTSVESMEQSASLISDLLAHYKLNCREELFSKDFNGKMIAAHMFISLRPKLQRKTWKGNPGRVAAFSRCALSLCFPHTSAFIDDIFPVSLLIMDDYETQHKVLGLRLLHHLMENCSRTELSWQGRAEVLYDALQRLTYSLEESVLLAVYPALLLCLSIVEKHPSTRHDAIFQRLLYNMQLENKIRIRQVYADHLLSYITALGHSVVKHFKRLLPIFCNYLEVYDGPKELIRLQILRSLRTTVQLTWWTLAGHSDDILKSLVRLIFDLSVDQTLTPEEVKATVVDLCVEVIILLKRANEDDVTAKIRAASEVNSNQVCALTFKRILEAS